MTELMDYAEARAASTRFSALRCTSSWAPRPRRVRRGPNAFGGDPNTFVTPVSLGLPGSLPVVNHKASSMRSRSAWR